MHAQKQDEYSHGCTSGTHLVITALYLSLVDHKQYQHTYNLYHDSYQNAAATEVFLKIVPTGMPPPNEVCTKVIGFIMTAPPPPRPHTPLSLLSWPISIANQQQKLSRPHHTRPMAYFGSVRANCDVRFPSWFESKTHDLPLGKQKQQNKHLSQKRRRRLAQ